MILLDLLIGHENTMFGKKDFFSKHFYLKSNPPKRWKWKMYNTHVWIFKNDRVLDDGGWCQCRCVDTQILFTNRFLSHDLIWYQVWWCIVVLILQGGFRSWCVNCAPHTKMTFWPLLLSHKIRAVPAVSGIHSGLTMVITSHATKHMMLVFGTWYYLQL